MKKFLFVSIALIVFAAWAADRIMQWLESEPVLVLIVALVLLAVVVCYVLLRPGDDKPDSSARDPRAWMNPHARTRQTRGASTAKRLHTDARGETWWEVTNTDGRVTLEHENYDDIMAETEAKLRKI